MTVELAPLRKCAAAEGVGSALFLASVVGSGIMAERLFGGSVGLALLASAPGLGSNDLHLTNRSY